MPGRIVALEGPSASGKSSVAARWAERTGGTVVEEAFERLRPRPSLALGSPRNLLELELALLREEPRRLAVARLGSGRGRTVLLDTGVLGPLTYTAGLVADGRAPPSLLDRLLAEARRLRDRGRWALPTGIVYLLTPSSVRRARAGRDPRGHPSVLRRRHEQVGAWEIRFYRRALAPILGDRLRFVSGRGAPDHVAEHVVAAIDLLPRSLAPAALSERVLRELEAPGGPRPRGNS